MIFLEVNSLKLLKLIGRFDSIRHDFRQLLLEFPKNWLVFVPPIIIEIEGTLVELEQSGIHLEYQVVAGAVV